MIDSIQERGWCYSLGSLINRVVPEPLFRFRYTGVYELQAPSLPSAGTPASAEQPISPQEHHEPNGGVELPTGSETDGDVEIIVAETTEQRQTAAQVSRFHGDPNDEYLSAYLAVRRGTTVAAIWNARVSYDEPELGLRYEMAGSVRWWFAARVETDRRTGVYLTLLRTALEQEPEMRHLAAINPTDKASLAAYRSFIVRRVDRYVAARLMYHAVCLGGKSLGVQTRWTNNAVENPIEILV